MDVKKMASMGQKAMREKQSAAERVFWPLQAGRPRQFRPDLIEAIFLGKSAANRFYSAVQEAGLRIDRSKEGCYLLCAKSGKIPLWWPFTPENNDGADLRLAERIVRQKLEPIGIGFILKDQQKNKVLVHGRSFSPEHLGLIKTWVSDREVEHERE